MLFESCSNHAPASSAVQHCAFHMETFRVHTKSTSPTAAAAAAAGRGPPSVTFLFVFNGGGASQVALEITHKPRPASAGAAGSPTGGGRDDTILDRLPPSPSNGEGRVTMTLGGRSVPHLPGEPYSCYIHQVGNVTFNPRKQVRGREGGMVRVREGACRWVFFSMGTCRVAGASLLGRIVLAPPHGARAHVRRRLHPARPIPLVGIIES